MGENEDRKARPKGNGEPRGRDTMLQLEMVAAPLAYLLPPETPSADLFARIAAKAGIETGVPGFFVCRSSENGWKPAGEGIRVRSLSSRQAGGRVTILMEMQPGAILPPHEHEADEECYVVEGEFEMEGTVYRTGDFLIARKGSVHPAVASPKGCRVLLSMATAH